MANKKIVFETPTILVNQNQLLIHDLRNDGKNVLLQAGENKNSNGEINFYLMDETTKKIDKTKVIATMSYKKVGQKLAKKISLVNGWDFYFKYNKDSGYFDKQSDLLSKYGNEYSISNMTLKKFYSELIEVLKLRLALGYIQNEDKTQPADFYFRQAHKYILIEKYKLNLDECMNFVRGVVAKSYIPEKFTKGFLEELHKSFYNTELSRSEILEIETAAKISLMNEKRAKVPVDNLILHTKILDEIRKKDSVRKMNIMKLREAICDDNTI